MSYTCAEKMGFAVRLGGNPFDYVTFEWLQWGKIILELSGRIVPSAELRVQEAQWRLHATLLPDEPRTSTLGRQ